MSWVVAVVGGERCSERGKAAVPQGACLQCSAQTEEGLRRRSARSRHNLLSKINWVELFYIGHSIIFRKDIALHDDIGE